MNKWTRFEKFLFCAVIILFIFNAYSQYTIREINFLFEGYKHLYYVKAGIVEEKEEIIQEIMKEYKEDNRCKKQKPKS